MENVAGDTTQQRTFESGRVRVEVTEDGRLERLIVHPTGELFEVLLTLDPEESKALFRVLEHVFGHWDERPAYAPPRELWSGTRYHYLAPLCDRPDIFWLSLGSLNCYVSTTHMKAVYDDLRTGLELASLTLG